MSDLGHLVWWKVPEGSSLSLAAAHERLTGVNLPAAPIPIDVFRRVTGTVQSSKRYGDRLLQVYEGPPASDKVMTRHIVVMVKGSGTRVGDVAFFKPPRGEHRKARLKVTLRVKDDPDVNDYAARLKQQYAEGIAGTLDTQGIRRIVRGHMIKVGGLFLEGPWYVQNTDPVMHLLGLFDLLGEEAFLHEVPFPDTEGNRAFLTRGLERAIKAGTEVDETIWKRLEAT